MMKNQRSVMKELEAEQQGKPWQRLEHKPPLAGTCRDPSAFILLTIDFIKDKDVRNVVFLKTFFPHGFCLFSHPVEIKRRERAGWRSTPSQPIRVSPKLSPVHLTSTNRTDTAASTLRPAALPHSHVTGKYYMCHSTAIRPDASIFYKYSSKILYNNIERECWICYSLHLKWKCCQFHVYESYTSRNK